MTRVVVALVLIAAAVAVAWLLQRRRRTDAPTQATFTAPAQLDRSDFPEAADRPWLVVAFTSATCGSCADMARKAQVLASPQVAVVEVEATARPALHRRYRIEAVPIVVVAGADGVVQASFVGPASATDLWAAVAEAREPGSRPHGGECQREADAEPA